MKQQNTLGIIGGMSWESTQVYYQLLNSGIRDTLGGQHSAHLILHSLDFAHIEALQARNDWSSMAQVMADSAKRLKLAGVNGILIASNTMHKLADSIVRESDLPLIHIADATVEVIKSAELTKIAILGTKFTMSNASDNHTHFYKKRFIESGIDVLVPNENEQNVVHQIIYDELCQGIISPSSRETYLRIIESLAKQGAQGVVLGCTEIGLLIKPTDCRLPVFDTTQIHAQAGVNFCLNLEMTY